jgi:hypothetical protein
MKAILIGGKVKFQPAEGFPIRDASVAWIAGDVTFLHVPTMENGQLVRIDVEVVQECDDGIFRRVENLKLETMDKDVLSSLRKSAEEINQT